MTSENKATKTTNKQQPIQLTTNNMAKKRTSTSNESKFVKIKTLADELKYEFFMENFNKISLEQLESLVK